MTIFIKVKFPNTKNKTENKMKKLIQNVSARNQFDKKSILLMGNFRNESIIKFLISKLKFAKKIKQIECE